MAIEEDPDRRFERRRVCIRPKQLARCREAESDRGQKASFPVQPERRDCGNPRGREQPSRKNWFNRRKDAETNAGRKSYCRKGGGIAHGSRTSNGVPGSGGAKRNLIVFLRVLPGSFFVP